MSDADSQKVQIYQVASKLLFNWFMGCRDFIVEHIEKEVFEKADDYINKTFTDLKVKRPREDEATSAKRRKVTYSNQQKNVLTAWINNNVDCPYPTEEEKIELSRASGLTKKQIETWFSNYRRRGNLLCVPPNTAMKIEVNTLLANKQ
ncbi:hypothetical protein AKO1_011877 [Acrasis kona]|uniref:Homeobox domain-containing protein n=1 Tax=Acrasis kona TaxID=1008807 RepID=A0AAW2Z4H1_9EUKA